MPALAGCGPSGIDGWFAGGPGRDGAKLGGGQGVQGGGDGVGLPDVNGARAQRGVHRRMPAEGGGLVDQPAGAAGVQQQPGAQPPGGAADLLPGREVAGVDLADQVQLDPGQRRFQPVHLLHRGDQVGVGQRPQRRVGALGRVVPEPFQCVQHTATLAQAYDNFLRDIDQSAENRG